MRTRIPGLQDTVLIALVIGCLTLVSGCKTRTHYAALPIPFDRNELVGSWIGFNDRDATCYKLVLRAAGDGVLYSQFHEGTSATNTIPNWRMEGNRLQCDFQGDTSPTSPAFLTCEVKKSLLTATLVGVGWWKEKLQFRRTEFLEQSLVKAKMSEPAQPAVPHKR